jgi:hypothetical protein
MCGRGRKCNCIIATKGAKKQRTSKGSRRRRQTKQVARAHMSIGKKRSGDLLLQPRRVWAALQLQTDLDTCRKVNRCFLALAKSMWKGRVLGVVALSCCQFLVIGGAGCRASATLTSRVPLA